MSPDAQPRKQDLLRERDVAVAFFYNFFEARLLKLGVVGARNRRVKDGGGAQRHRQRLPAVVRFYIDKEAALRQETAVADRLEIKLAGQVAEPVDGGPHGNGLGSEPGVRALELSEPRDFVQSVARAAHHRAGVNLASCCASVCLDRPKSNWIPRPKTGPQLGAPMSEHLLLSYVW